MLVNFSSKELGKLQSILTASDNKASLRDTIVLCMGEAIYHCKAICSLYPDIKVLVLRDDFLLAGLTEDNTLKLVDYDDWVSLSIENTPVITI